MLVSRMVMVVALAPYLVWAQLGASPENSTVENCECSPACEGGVGGGGCRGRVMAREDCPCCRVCAQQAGDPCSLPSLPCDKEFGLVCSPEGVCQAEFACASDPECPDDRFCLGGVCVDPCPILTPCSGALKGGVCVSKDHRPVCECPSGTIANSDAKLCIPYNGTETGCQHEERLYAVDEVRYSDKCQEQCRCGSDGTFSCGPVTCPPGLFLAGQHSQQEMCIELRNRPETDECCVVVACANSLARPSLLTSPVLSRPSLGVEEHDGQQLQVLRGRKAGPGIPSPITGEEYQKQLKELEVEVNKKHEKKKTTDVKESEQHKQGGSDAVAVVGDAVEEAVDAPVTEVVTELGTLAGEEEVTTPPWDVEGSVQETVDEVTEAEGFTTLMPTTQEEEQVRDGEDAALVLEYDDTGDLVHRITVHERVEVVTQPATLEEETSTPPTQQEEETSLAREGKKAPDDANVTQDEPTDTESIKLLEAKGGSGALKVVEVTHNSSTVVLPSSKGGEVYYKAAEGNEWLRVMVESGQDSLVLKGLHPSTQYTLKWSGVSGGSAKITIDTQEVCRVGNETYAIGHNWAQGCQERCSCRPGGVVDCQPRCIFAAGDITNPQCEERPAPEDPECCVVYDCKSDESDITGTVASGAQENAGLPKLLVTAKTHNSVTLAWDDFRARTYKGGYVAEYREEPADPATGIVVEQPWMRKEVPPGELPPKLTVEGLRPNTLYEVRVSIYDDVEEGRLGEATETINVKTEAGCVYGNSSHSVGEFYNGCEERCMCVATGDVQCFERCTLPYFRAGSFRGDPLCSEHPDERDECCVTVRCASDRREAYNQCTNVVCGQNAECISGTMASKDLRLSDIDSDLTLGYCRCLKGFTGDASDLDSGCVPDPSAGHKEGSCTFKNSTYRSGDVFHDECDYRCSCSNNSEIECEPRCEFPHEDGSQTEPGCEYIPDPKDHCCKLRVCNSTSEAATDAARAPSLPSDGCTEGNITYARDEKFYNGCETSCTCLGFGDVSCTPRCPPLKVVSATPKRCDTLPDPLDTCCSITVCDAETPDVMKANITELEKKMMKMNMTDMEKEMKMKEMMMNMTGAEKEALMNISKIERIPNDMDAMMPEEDIATTVMPEKEMLIHLNEHTHDDGTTHSHPHEHGMDETLNHTDHDGQAHDHDKNGQQAHNNHDIFTGIHNHTHTHENGVTHTHPHEHNMDNMHDHEHNMNDTHTHEDGTTHSHPHDHTMDHTHDNDTHTHEDGTTHSHPHDRTMDHTHDNDTHTHEDGTTHSHPHDHTMDHTHDNDTHTHEDGTTHSHPHDRTMDHTHDNDTNDTHTHEDGTTHSHPHDRTMDHTHDHGINDTHTHEDGTTHSHPHDRTMDHTHDHGTNDTHTHEDGTTHSHPHVVGMNSTHNQEHDMNETHNHTHMWDGVSHIHPGGQEMDEDHNHTHVDSLAEGNEHTHEDGVTHFHAHEDSNHTHMPEDGINDFHNHTSINILEKKNRAEDLGTHDLNILEVMAVNSTTVMIRLDVSNSVMNQIQSSDDQHFMVLYSPDSLIWPERKIPVSEAKIGINEIVLYLNDLKPSTPYQFRVAFQDFVSSTSKARLLDGTVETDGTDGVDIDTSKMCSRNGRHYKPGQDFFEDCASFCICKEDMKIHCAAIECPVNFGLDLKDPNCLEWDQDPHYVPTPPKCCPQVKCIMTSACVYMGQTFNNYDEIPRELTGCSQECSCNYGNVTCRDLCAPVPSIPPPELNCEPQNAVLITLPGETCCRSWQCAAHSGVGTLVSFPVPPGSEMSDTHTSGFVPIAHPVNPILGADGIAEPYVTPLDARNVHFFFSTPKHYQGLPGELLIRFTNDPVSQADPSTWSQEILVPMGSIISQSEWDHLLTGLQPSTVYSMQVVLTVHGTEPVTSPVITYTTMEEATPPPTTTPLPRLDINAELYASEITKTTAKVSWRGFDDFELHYIDGVQVKYTEKDKLIPKFSQLFHRDNDQMDLRGLQPGHSYTVDLVFITHENQTTQVSNTKPITFTTLPEEDPYAFEIEVTAGKVASQTAELFYSGVPEPEEKYINVYRAVYLREDERVDAESFKVPKTGHEKKILLHELKPDVEYQVWIEAYLSNGRKKKSNVLTITTRAGQLPKPERSEVDPSTKESKDSEGYYPALVAVAIIAAIACLGFLGLLIILLRKQSHAKAHINSARNNAAYDNPSYKVGDNTYDMEMNGIKGSGNGATHMEEP